MPVGPILDKAKELNKQYDAGLLTLDDFVTALVKVTGREPKPIEGIFTKPESVKNTELIEYIKILKVDYKIGMLSNVGTNWVREYFLSPDEQKLFTDMVFSYEVGMTKPDHRIYEITAQKLGLSPPECMFIDDQPRYCQAAKEVGMTAIIYENFKQMKTELEEILKN